MSTSVRNKARKIKEWTKILPCEIWVERVWFECIRRNASSRNKRENRVGTIAKVLQYPLMAFF